MAEGLCLILFVVGIFLFDLFDRLDSYAELVDRLRSEVAHERSEREAGKHMETCCSNVG